MQEILSVIGKITFIVLIVGGVFSGISFAVEVLIMRVLKKINKTSNENYSRINEENRKICDGIIESSKQEFIEFTKINKENKNKIRKFFKIKELPIKENPTTFLKIFLNLYKQIGNVFAEEKGKNGYLSFTEKQVFDIVETLLNRVEKIFNSTGIIWFKYIKISFFIECFSIYGTAVKFKNKTLIVIVLSVIDFFLKFNRLISPVAVGKYALKSIGADGVSGIISSTLISVIGKELSAIYNDKTQKDVLILEKAV